jgi:hypothetical protein
MIELNNYQPVMSLWHFGHFTSPVTAFPEYSQALLFLPHLGHGQSMNWPTVFPKAEEKADKYGVNKDWCCS